jgi:drug/metabolite transporter (DMT)-like permease
MNKIILMIALFVLGVLTAYSVVHVGGVIELVMIHLRHPAGWQIFADLVIAMCLLLIFVKQDAERTGRPFWPWAIFSITCGSFGPLLYFITAKKKK